MSREATSEAAWARADGKIAVQERRVWQLEAPGFRLRCLHEEDGKKEFVVQAYVGGKWETEVARGPSAAVLLKKAATVVASKLEASK